MSRKTNVNTMRIC